MMTVYPHLRSVMNWNQLIHISSTIRSPLLLSKKIPNGHQCNFVLHSYFYLKQYHWGSWLAYSVGHVTPGLWVMSLSPHLALSLVKTVKNSTAKTVLKNIFYFPFLKHMLIKWIWCLLHQISSTNMYFVSFLLITNL